MNFTEALNYLYSLGHEMLAMKLGLDSIAALCSELGEPQLRYKVVHIAGTNGKGSTAAMVEAIGLAAGHRIGLYTSPHLVSITERVRVNGQEISPEDFARLASAKKDFVRALRLAGAAATLRQAIGLPLPLLEQTELKFSLF